MASLKQLRNRVKSIKSTQKITKAMQVIAASKLKKIKDQAENLNDYSEVLKNIMIAISNSGKLIDLPESNKRFFFKDFDLPYLLVVMTSERGLCGGFNSAVIKKVKSDLSEFTAKGKGVKLLIVGKKGYDAFKNKYLELIESYYNISRDSYEAVAIQLRDKIISMVEKEEIGACYMYYNWFKNAMAQVITREQVLPISNGNQTQLNFDYEYEGAGLIHDIINLYIGGQINYGLLQNKASEEGARVTAMDNATRNAGELIQSLTLKLNRSRQAIITTELTEIISGAEAL